MNHKLVGSSWFQALTWDDSPIHQKMATWFDGSVFGTSRRCLGNWKTWFPEHLAQGTRDPVHPSSSMKKMKKNMGLSETMHAQKYLLLRVIPTFTFRHSLVVFHLALSGICLNILFGISSGILSSGFSARQCPQGSRAGEEEGVYGGRRRGEEEKSSCKI